MKRIIEYFVAQSVFGDLLSVAVIALGTFAMFNVKREVFPNVNFDIVSVTTIFPGASPEEVEKLITNPIEQELKEVDGLKKIQSVSIEGRSRLTIWLDPDQTSDDKGKQDIKDAIDRIKNTELPEEAEDPIVAAVESKLNPIIEVSLAGNIDPLKLRQIAKDVESEIEQIPGVARVVHRGLRDIEVRVEADQRKLSSYRISLEELIQALQKQNLSVPGGIVEVSLNKASGKERIVKTEGDFKSPEEVGATVIRANDVGQVVRVRDVAKVFPELARATIINHTNGLPALSLTILKKESSDAIDLVDSVKRKIEELRPTLDPGIQIEFINDLSIYIKRRLSILTGNLAIGLLFVLALLPFMIPLRFSVLVALGEPFAFLGTILIFYWMGYSINLISMLGLIIVSGILVDDSIVVTENAVRLVDEGVDPKEAAVRGTLQIMGPVTASVLTTTFAFLPMAFMSGIFGKFVVQVPIAVMTALAVSLIETFFILPAHIAHWITPKSVSLAKQSRRGKYSMFRIMDQAQAYWEEKVTPTYVRILSRAISARYRVMGVFIVLFFGSLFLAKSAMKVVLFPPEGIEIFFIRTETPTGTSLAQHEALLKPIEALVHQLPAEELDSFTTSIGIVQQDPNDPATKRGNEYAQIAVYLTPEKERNRFANEIIDELRDKAGTPPGFVSVSFSRVRPGPPQGKPVSLGVRGSEYSTINQAARDLKEFLKSVPGVSDISDSYIAGKEELVVKLNPAEAAASGVSVASVGNTVRASYEGIVATSIRKLDEEIDVRVSLSGDQRSSNATLDSILVPNRFNQLIPLSSVARIENKQGISVYEHEANDRQVMVTSELDTKLASTLEVNAKVKDFLPEFKKKHPGVGVYFGGEGEDTEESLASLGRAFILAITAIFLLLVLTFKNLFQPMVVLLTVPLGIIAVIWAFFLHGMPFSFMGFLGIISLAGVIVNNAIVFVDFVNEARSNGVDQTQSILDAGRLRLRPIFLTTVTTVVGILPTAYGMGGLDKFVVPIAMALGWGLMFGSILTAFVFPPALAILDDIQGFFHRRVASKFKSAVGIA